MQRSDPSTRSSSLPPGVAEQGLREAGGHGILSATGEWPATNAANGFAKATSGAGRHHNRSQDMDFAPDSDIVVPAAQELALIDADRLRSSKFTG